MSRKTLRKFLVALVCLSGFSVSAQTIVNVKLYSETNERSYFVEDSGKLYFLGDNLYVDQSGSMADAIWPLSEIQRVTFKSTSDVESVASEYSSCFLYPNPATEKVFVYGMKDGAVVRVYSVDGVELLVATYDSENGIDIEKLSVGLYFVNVGSLTFKMEKR